MTRFVLTLAVLGLSTVGRARTEVSAAVAPLAPDQIEQTLTESIAYQGLLLELRALEKKISTTQYGYFGQDQRKKQQQQLKQLQRVKIRIDSYTFALPPNCAEYQPLSVGKAPPTAVRVMTGPGEHVVHAQGRKQPGFKSSAAYTPRDIRCRPRMRISDQMVALVRESEQLNHHMKTHRFAFHEIKRRQELERRQIRLERDLLKMGVAPDVRATVTQIDVVDVTVRGGQLAPTRPK